jgi:XTP/dITP diphosphohydrolase
MRVLVASSNPHKLEEIAAVFEEQRRAASKAVDQLSLMTDALAHPTLPELELITLTQAGLSIPEPEEDQPTFEGNAILKARYYAKASGLPTIADDSGLEVDILNQQPGVLSARYAGVSGPRNVVDPANNKLLMENLKGIPAEGRTARFVCAMALAKPEASIEDAVVVRGEVPGRIIGDGESPRGQHGFGYDPLFYLPDMGKTMAELLPEEKNALSHRGRASRLLWEKLPAILTP